MRVGQSAFDEKSQPIYGGDKPNPFVANVPLMGSYWYLYNAELYQEQKEFSVNPSLMAKFAYGPTRNTLVLGGDYSRISENAFMAANFMNIWAVNLMTPVFHSYVAPPVADRMSDVANVYETSGAYAQLQSTIYDRLHLLGGVRLSNITIDSYDNLAHKDTTTDDTKVLPRGGAVSDLTKHVSLFTDYGEGQKANPFTLYVGTPKPETSDQTEGGVKFNFNDKFSDTLRLRNQPEQCARRGGFGLRAQWPGPHHRLRGRPYLAARAGVAVHGSYAYLDAHFVKSDPKGSGAVAGNWLNGVPENSGRLWANYKFSQDWLRGFKRWSWRVYRGRGICRPRQQVRNARILHRRRQSGLRHV